MRYTGPVGLLRTYASFIRVSHSVFALPFAYLSAIIAGASFKQLVLITVAMVGARTFAMAANRIIEVTPQR